MSIFNKISPFNLMMTIFYSIGILLVLLNFVLLVGIDNFINFFLFIGKELSTIYGLISLGVLIVFILIVWMKNKLGKRFGAM